jgi:IS30 family transposase
MSLGEPQRRPRPVSGVAGRSAPTAVDSDPLVHVPYCSARAQPKQAELARCRRLRRVVERKLAALWSPEQISAWLAEQYPDDPEMWVSHETIYQSLFVQSRGALRQELHSCLRSGRAMRRAKAYTKGNVGQRKIRDMVMISQRPAEIEDRAVPGHWEGDLIFGKKMTAIANVGRAPQPLRDARQAPKWSRRRSSPQSHDEEEP